MDARFNGAGKTMLKTNFSSNLIAINDQMISLVYLLLVSILGAAIAIVHGDREGHRRG